MEKGTERKRNRKEKERERFNTYIYIFVCVCSGVYIYTMREVRRNSKQSNEKKTERSRVTPIQPTF